MQNQNEISVVPRADIVMTRDPEVVLAEAKKAAAALMKVVELKKDPVRFNGQQYLEFEDWQTVANFYGLTVKVVRTEPVDFGGVKGFEAHAEVLRMDGAVVSAADAMCLNDEDNWSTRAKYEYKDRVKTKVGEVPVPMFQLRSMAQTRACAKALRNVLAWVVVLAGFKPSVAEEMTGDELNGDPGIRKPAKSEAAPANLDFKEMKARRSGKCTSCKGDIKEGDTILFSSKLGTFHPACIKPEPAKEEPAPVQKIDISPLIKNLVKLAETAKVKLIDRIGADGYESIDQLRDPKYINSLISEMAERIDAQGTAE